MGGASGQSERVGCSCCSAWLQVDPLRRQQVLISASVWSLISRPHFSQRLERLGIACPLVISTTPGPYPLLAPGSLAWRSAGQPVRPAPEPAQQPARPPCRLTWRNRGIHFHFQVGVCRLFASQAAVLVILQECSLDRTSTTADIDLPPCAKSIRPAIRNQRRIRAGL